MSLWIRRLLRLNLKQKDLSLEDHENQTLKEQTFELSDQVKQLARNLDLKVDQLRRERDYGF